MWDLSRRKKVFFLANSKAKRSRRKQRNRRSFILTLALIALIGYFTISLISLQFQINAKQQELTIAQQTLQQEEKKNTELKEIAKENDQDRYMERIARDVLGYVKPGESVYYDISSGSGHK